MRGVLAVGHGGERDDHGHGEVAAQDDLRPARGRSILPGGPRRVQVGVWSPGGGWLGKTTSKVIVAAAAATAATTTTTLAATTAARTTATST